MHKFICLSICSLFFLFAFSQAKASDELTNVAVRISSGQPVVSGSVSDQVAGVLVIFDHLGSNQDFTVSVSQDYPVASFTTTNDCFSPSIGSCRSQLPAGLYDVRVEVSDGELRLLSAVNLSQKLLVNAQKSELLEAETISAESLKSPITPMSAPPATPSTIKPAKVSIKTREQSPPSTVATAKPESTTEIIEIKSQIKGAEASSVTSNPPKQILFIILYISVGLFIAIWGLYFYKRFKSKIMVRTQPR